MAPPCYYENKLIFLTLLLFANFMFWHLHYRRVNDISNYAETRSHPPPVEHPNKVKEICEKVSINPNQEANPQSEKLNEQEEIDKELWNGSFDSFNNETGADRFIVPNIIHFIRFQQEEYSLIDYVVIKAAMRNHRPDYFFIHTDVPGPGNFTSRYWNLIQKDYELWSRIRLLHLEAPSEIFGQKLSCGL